MSNPNVPIYGEDPSEIEDVSLKDVSIRLHIQTVGALNAVFGGIGSCMAFIVVVVLFGQGIYLFQTGQEMVESGSIINQICGGMAIFLALPMLMSVFLLIWLPYLILIFIAGIGLLKKQFWARILGIGLAGFQLLLSLSALFNNIFSLTSSRVEPNTIAHPPAENTFGSIVILLLMIIYSVYVLFVLTSRRAGTYFQRKIHLPE